MIFKIEIIFKSISEFYKYFLEDCKKKITRKMAKNRKKKEKYIEIKEFQIRL